MKRLTIRKRLEELQHFLMSWHTCMPKAIGSIQLLLQNSLIGSLRLSLSDFPLGDLSSYSPAVIHFLGESYVPS
jgi:hypothetical protein